MFHALEVTKSFKNHKNLGVIFETGHGVEFFEVFMRCWAISLLPIRGFLRLYAKKVFTGDPQK